MSELAELTAFDLLGRMMAVELYLVHNKIQTAPSSLGPHLRDHLLYMIKLEKSGKLFASGPLIDTDGQMTGDGVTILRAANMSEAKELAGQDPFVVAGLRVPSVQKWVMNEGRISVSIDLSDGTSMFI